MSTNRKSYNLSALRGESYNDEQWQADLAEAEGIFVPTEYLYSPKGPEYAMEQMKMVNFRDYLADGLDEKAAMKKAEGNKEAAMKNFKALMK